MKLLKLALKYKQSILLILVCLLAFTLRIYTIDKSVWLQSGYDESRDMLVAEHLLYYSEFVTRGPLAAGGLNWLQNSPVYFYFISLLWFLSGDPVMCMYLWVVLFTVPVFLSFQIGRAITSSSLFGLVLAVLFALNPQMVASSRELLQPHILLLFSTCLVWIIVCKKNQKNTNQLPWILAALLCVMFPLHFHYGVLIAIPCGLLYTTLWWLEFNLDSTHFLSKGIVVPLVFFLFILFSWLLLSYTEETFDQLKFIYFNENQPYGREMLRQTAQSLNILGEMVFGIQHQKTSFLGIGIVIMVLLILAWKERNYLSEKIFLLLLSASILFVSFYRSTISATYLLYLLPIYLSSVCISLKWIWEKNMILSIALTLCLVGSYCEVNLDMLRKLPAISFHEQQKNVAKIISDHYHLEKSLTTQIPSLLITWYTTQRNMPYDGWGTSGTWYYLEKEFKKKLVVNVNNGVNHMPLVTHPTYIYMVCDHRTQAEQIADECVDRFKRAYAVTEESFSFIGQTDSLSVWVFERADTRVPVYNVVHKDLLIDMTLL